MKFCTDCDFSKKEVVQFPNGQAGMVLVCQNMECRNPVDASMFPCEIVRREQIFCGIGAKYFKLKEVPVGPAKKEGSSVIQLVK